MSRRRHKYPTTLGHASPCLLINRFYGCFQNISHRSALPQFPAQAQCRHKRNKYKLQSHINKSYTYKYDQTKIDICCTSNRHFIALSANSRKIDKSTHCAQNDTRSTLVLLIQYKFIRYNTKHNGKIK